jgi:iron complex outermembrane receptor protein
MKHALSLSVSVLALVSSAAAFAQTSETKSGGIETVVVTAERRTENLMTTPISADVINGSELAAKGVARVEDLQFVAPAVTINNFGQGIDFNIRGIGKGEHNSQTLTGVITYRDGVPTFPGYFTEEPYYDIASVEVLRGPQGTFVGQNATGGAVFVSSNDPVIGGDYNGYIMSQFGNYSDGMLQGAVNVPVSDTFALRLSAFGDARGSFYSITDSDPADKYADCKPGYNPGDLRWGAGRISALWKPTDALTVSFKLDGDYLDNGAYPADPYYSTNDMYHITANAKQLGLDRFMRAILKVDYVLPDGITLRSVSGYQNGNTNYYADLDGFDLLPAPYDYTFFDRVDDTIYSQEVNVISPNTGRVTWIAGAFAQASRLGWEKPYQFVIHQSVPPFGSGDYMLQGSTPYAAWAVFGQVGVDLGSGLQAQLGGRWSANRSNNNGDIIQYGLPLTLNQATQDYSFDYKASLNWTINDDHFAYGFIATGYKPGGLNVPVGLGVPAPFGPERVTEYELGWKANWLDGHLRTQVDGYYNDYKNFQVIIGYPAFPVFGFEVNDPNATKIYGFEAETQGSFGPLSFSAGLGLMHSALGKFFATDPRIASLTPCDPQTGPASPSCIDLDGHPQTYAPSFSANLSVQYQFDLGGGDTLTPRVNYAHESGQWATLFDNAALGDRLSPRDLLGAQLEWAHDDWSVALYSTNLTDQHYVAALNSGLRFAGFPRQYGIRLFKTF